MIYSKEMSQNLSIIILFSHNGPVVSGLETNENLLACVFPIKANVITNTDACLIYKYQIFTLNIQYGTIP